MQQRLGVDEHGKPPSGDDVLVVGIRSTEQIEQAGESADRAVEGRQLLGLAQPMLDPGREPVVPASRQHGHACQQTVTEPVVDCADQLVKGGLQTQILGLVDHPHRRGAFEGQHRHGVAATVRVTQPLFDGADPGISGHAQDTLQVVAMLVKPLDQVTCGPLPRQRGGGQQATENREAGQHRLHSVAALCLAPAAIRLVGGRCRGGVQAQHHGASCWARSGEVRVTGVHTDVGEAVREVVAQCGAGRR